MSWLTIKEHCIEVFKTYPEQYENDASARRIYWDEYTDMLRREGMISKHQFTTWSNPF